MVLPSSQPSNLAQLTPPEVDTFLSQNWIEQAKARTRIISARQTVKHYQDETFSVYRRYVEEAQQEIAHQKTILTSLRTTASPYEQEYRRRLWSRYFLVNNQNGHVHRAMDCPTCYPTTQYQWLPSLSGSDEPTMVAEFGEIACTICFPSAPTHPGFSDGTSALARYSAAEKAARAAERAARAEAKAVKTFAPPVVVPNLYGHTTRIETVYQAKQCLKSMIDQTAWGYGKNNPRWAPEMAEATRLLSAALTTKGIDPVPLIAKWKKAAAKESSTS